MNKNNAAAIRRLKAAFTGFQREVEQILKELEHANNVSICSLPEVEACIRLAARHFRFSESDILSRDRNGEVAWARQVAIYLASKTTQYRDLRIAECFRKCRSNINHAVQSVEARISVDKAAKADVDKLLKELGHES